MVFASLAFLYVFLPVNLLLALVTRSLRLRNLQLLAFSLAFYAWGEPVWVVLLLLSASLDYCIGRIVERTRGTGWARLALGTSVVVNLSLLGLFKYSAWLFGMIGDATGLELVAPKLSLPIGISFYTFQTISYSIDVYRGRVAAQRSYTNFLLYVSLYPQLIAGPIVRYADIAEQIEDRTRSFVDASAGLSRFCLGLFKKVALANVAAELVAQYLDADPSTLTVAEAWLGIAMFSLQIYFDFSGYSDMAIGLGRVFGFRYPENFDYPYIARSVAEFWRRWHISLGSFFRDYVYIPLGGNRRWHYRNIAIVWFLTGLWHGASWNFALWGLYFGVFITLEHVFLGKLLDRLPRLVGHVYLLFVVVVGWGLFYFTDLSRLVAYYRVMFAVDGAALCTPELLDVLHANAMWLGVAVLACGPTWVVVTGRLRHFARSAPALVALQLGEIAVNLGCLAIATALLVGHTYNPFLYLRF